MLDTSPLNQRVYQLLLDRILSAELAPGQRLDPEKLSRDLGTSRTPIKDALARLSAEGLITIVPRQGTLVAKPTLCDAEELHDVRLMIELHVAERAVSAATPADDNRLEALLLEWETFLVDDGYSDAASALVVDHQFHQSYVELAGNRRLSELYRNVQHNLRLTQTYLGHRLPESHLVRKEHRAILDAFTARSTERFKAAITNHVTRRVARIRHVLTDGQAD